MSRACYQVSWGLLLILIDIRFEWIDVFPDIVGYLLLLTGLSYLKGENKYFRIGYRACWLVMLISLIQFWMGFNQSTVRIEQIGAKSPWAYGLQMLPLVGNMVLGYGVCRGIEERADKLKQTVLNNSARTRLSFYLILHLIWLIAWPFGLNLDEDIIIPLYFILGLGIIICSLSVMLLARAAGRLWREEGRAV